MARRAAVALTLAPLVAGCGGAQHSRTPASTTTATRTATTPATTTTGTATATTSTATATTNTATARTSTASASSPAFAFLPGALVTMRQFSPQSLLWQEISIQPDGHVLLTTIIGEISGAVRRRLTLAGAQTAKLHRLVSAARRVAPPTHHDPRAELYTLTLPGRPAENLQGPTPPALTALTSYLSGLMFTYCC